jgi:RNA polymerase sigma factor (sigma-70 family)
MTPNIYDFYETLSKKLVSVFQHQFGSYDAKVAVNESFEKYICSGMEMEYKTAYAWLYVAAKRKLLDHFRNEKRLRLKLNKMKHYSDRFDDPSNRLDLLDVAVFMKYLPTAIEKLPRRTREVMKEFLAGKSNQEIATILNMKLTTVKTHKSRAISFLVKLQKSR